MEDPVQDIGEVVHLLTQTPPREQATTINKYFTEDAAFTHPFCRTGSRKGSRQLIHYIFQWYKVMSPKIQLKVNSVAFDESNLILYVNISQIFAIWFVPTHSSDVTLTTVLKLERDSGDRKYYITSQEDLYQTDQFIKFVFPWGGSHLVMLWQFIATFNCALLAIIFTPFTILLQLWADKQERTKSQKQQQEGQNKPLTNGKPLVDQAREAADKAKEEGAKVRNRVQS